MAATSLHFQSVFEEGLDKVLRNQWIYTKTIRLFALALYAWLTQAAP